MDTVTLTIDGRQITVEKGTTILQAAIANGIQIPFYCYHPGLGVDGSCRVCIVRVEKMPKLQTACSTPCTDGMVVDTRSPEVTAARASVFEFLLINHPLDCPVCDKGGECPLQDYSYTFGREKSRMEFPRRVFDGEGVRSDVDFGPTLMLNRNRCILCMRCVRFMRDIDGDAQIGVADRGCGSEIMTFGERGVRSLLSGNLMDVCPVGAILTKDYRFKSRPWDNPLAVDTVCTLCSKGCNTTAWIKAKPEWAKGPSLVRFTPRFNPEVNGYWMCDIGRFGYHWIESDDRLGRPLVRSEAGLLEPAPWRETMAKLTGRLGAPTPSTETPGAGPGLRFLISAHASHEEMFIVGRIAAALKKAVPEPGEIGVSWRVSEKPQPTTTKFKISRVDAPNVTGARDLGLIAGRDPADGPDLSALEAAVRSGEVKALYVFDPGPDGSIGDLAWVVAARKSGRLPLLVVHGVVMTDLARAADFVLPGASYVEKEATYTNEQGRLQAVSRAMSPPGDAMEDWQILVNLALALGIGIDYTSPAHVRSDIASVMGGHPSFAGIAEPVFNRPIPARSWLQVSNPSERWKWDFLFRDVPPLKFKGTPEAPSPRSFDEGAVEEPGKGPGSF
ncbi:MAG: 2Fe-2S iron-sulfur cluster-binding protein [Vicinamibacterales bacterium]